MKASRLSQYLARRVLLESKRAQALADLDIVNIDELRAQTQRVSEFAADLAAEMSGDGW